MSFPFPAGEGVGDRAMCRNWDAIVFIISKLKMLACRNNLHEGGN